MCCLVLQSNFALLLTIQFASLFFILFFFSATILSGVEFFIFGDRSSVAYKATENLSRFVIGPFHVALALSFMSRMPLLLLNPLYLPGLGTGTELGWLAPPPVARLFVDLKDAYSISRFQSIRSLDYIFSFVSTDVFISSGHCASIFQRLRRYSSESLLWFRSGRIGGVCVFSVTWTTGWWLQSRGNFFTIRPFFSSCAPIWELSSTGRSQTYSHLLIFSITA